MTHWRKVGARDGQIYIQDSLGEWHWVTPSHTRRSMHRLLVLIVSIAVALLVASVALFSYGHARADGLPQYGVSCADIVLMQHRFGLRNTTKGRVQARAIAATLGFWLSDADIEEAALCLQTSTPKRDRG